MTIKTRSPQLPHSGLFSIALAISVAFLSLTCIRQLSAQGRADPGRKVPRILATDEVSIRKHVGKPVEIVGIPSERSNLIRNGYHFLLFDDSNFYASCKQADLRQVAPAGLARTFRGKTVSIFGTPNLVKGKPKISLSKRGQVRIANEEAAAALKNNDAGFEKKPSPSPAPPDPLPERPVLKGFSPPDNLLAKRENIPNFDQKDFKYSSANCIPNSAAAFLIWWDQAGVLPIPKDRKFDYKVNWIHKELARDMKSLSGTYHSDFVKGIKKYFATHFEKNVHAEAQSINGQLSPKLLAKATDGFDATILSVSVYKDDDYSWGHGVALLSADEEGNVQFNTWGHRYKGKLVEIPGKKVSSRGNADDKEYNDWKYKRRRMKKYEIVYQDDADNPRRDYLKSNNIRFVLDPEKWDALLMFRIQIRDGVEIQKDGKVVKKKE